MSVWKLFIQTYFRGKCIMSFSSNNSSKYMFIPYIFPNLHLEMPKKIFLSRNQYKTKHTAYNSCFTIMAKKKKKKRTFQSEDISLYSASIKFLQYHYCSKEMLLCKYLILKKSILATTNSTLHYRSSCNLISLS